MTWLTAKEYLCHNWPQVCSVTRNNNPVLSSCRKYHRVYNKSNTKFAKRGTKTDFQSEAPYFALAFFFTLLVGLFVVNLLIYMSSRFLVLCTLRFPNKADVRFVFTIICFVGSSCVIDVVCIY